MNKDLFLSLEKSSNVALSILQYINNNNETEENFIIVNKEAIKSLVHDYLYCYSKILENKKVNQNIFNIH